jgi:peptide/nickel transport system substrate-binding protein
MMLEKEPPAYLNNVVQVIDSVEQDGDYTVIFNLQDSYVPFIKTTTGIVPILPEHYWTSLMEETGTTDQPWRITINDDNPVVGSGPFQWGSWDQGSQFRMPAFEDHFKAPNIEERIQRPLSTTDAEMEALVNGDYDMLDYWFGDTQQLQSTVEESDFLGAVETLGTGRQSAWVNTMRPPFDDVAMRQAFNAVVNSLQPTIINEAFDGFGQEAHSFINPNLEFWHNPETTFFDGGIEGAATILADAGYVWDSDGNIYYPEGKTGK